MEPLKFLNISSYQRIELHHWFEFKDVLKLSSDVNDHQHLSPITSSFQDLWIKVISVMLEEWSLQFAKITQRYVFANFLELQNLLHDVNHAISFYILEKKKSGLIETYIVCIKYPSFNMSL
jgi:hypothetical protein